jgi:hypothetical protein
MGGSQGTTTVTQNSTPWNASQLGTVQNQAINLMNTDPINYYPGSTYSAPSPYQTSGYADAGNSYLNAGNAVSGSIPQAQSTALGANTNIAGGSGMSGISPYLSGLGAIGSYNPSAGASSALMGVPNGTAGNSLGAMANGAFLNSNPYLSGMMNAASQGVVNNYMTATAPQTDSAMEKAGEFGTPGLANAQTQNQLNLGTSLNNLASQIYGANYEQQTQNMLGAANDLGNLQTSAYGTAGQLANQGVATQASALNSAAGQYNTGLSNQQAAIGATPALTGMPSTDYSTAINAGAGTQGLNQAQLNSIIQSFYGNEMAPWTTNQEAAGIVGGAIPGTTTSTQPYYTNPFGQALGAATGVNSLLGSTGGIGALMGK